MQHVRFRDPAGSIRNGRWSDGTVSFGGSEYDAERVTILAPTDPSKIVCVGLNYADHAAETGKDVPDRPMLFLKPPNAVSHHGSTVTLPAGKERIDYEAEFGVVIGEQCRHVDESVAMDVVAGFTCGVDLSNRDDQRVEQNWVRGKAFDNASPLGPTLATPDEVPDDAGVKLYLNGELRQDSSREEFIFDVPALIAEITTYMTLEPGDVILTGTPAGVGALSDGDTITVEIDGIPPLEHSVEIP